jgi:hypothetical protein
MRFFLSPIVFVLGVLCMKYSVQITDQFSGKIDLAEKYLGAGIGAGTYTWWKLFGLLLCILSVLWLFNLLPHGATATPSTAPISYSHEWKIG